MIKTYKHKGLELFFVYNNKRYLNAKDVPKINRILDRLDAAIQVKDMNLIGWNLHQLTGNKSGIWAVSVSKIGESLLYS